MSSSANAEVSKCTIEKHGWSFVNPFPEFRFNTPAEVVKLLFWQKDNSDVPYMKHELDDILPFYNNFNEVHTSTNNSITWIGHASCLLKISGLFVLTDPIFSQNCSALQWSLSNKLKRFRDPGIQLDDIPTVDAVVISHNHYDHLDYYSVIDINKRFSNVKWLVPMGLKQWFVSSGIENRNVHEMTWWQETSLSFRDNTNLTFSCLPAQHWSIRNLYDRNWTLWCGWGIKSDERNVYFAGDTGYNSRIFNEIGHHNGPFDLSLIPIGAYEPREMLKFQHVNPDEAVKVHCEVKSKLSLGIHWGTFQLGYEHYMKPKQDLDDALKNQGVDKNKFLTFDHGHTSSF